VCPRGYVVVAVVVVDVDDVLVFFSAVTCMKKKKAASDGNVRTTYKENVKRWLPFIESGVYPNLMPAPLYPFFRKTRSSLLVS